MDSEIKKEIAKSELRQISNIEALLELATYQEKANTWTLWMVILILLLVIANGVEVGRLQTQVEKLNNPSASTSNTR